MKPIINVFRAHSSGVLRDSVESVAALAIDKVGPKPYHFRSGPTTQPGSKTSKIFVVHSLAVLKGRPERSS